MPDMPKNNFLKIPLLVVVFTCFLFSVEIWAGAEVNKGVSSGKLAVVRGIVQDSTGKPISKATVSFLHARTSKLLKQATAAKSGKFFAKIMPGTYTILAAAQGFKSATVKKVEVKRSSELVYGFKLKRSGLGNTAPEKRADRNSPKWRIRAASRRSVYQHQKGALSINKEGFEKSVQETRGNAAKDEQSAARRGQTLIETIVVNGKGRSYAAYNFATFHPLGENAEIAFAGQTFARQIGKSKPAIKRFEASLAFRPRNNHQLLISGSISKLGKVKLVKSEEPLSRVSFQALNQWKVNEGLILALGLDYSRFFGVGNDSLLSPSLSLQLDVDQRTRIRTAFTARAEESSWRKAAVVESSQSLFHAPIIENNIAIENGKPKMNKNKRLEFGIERTLDNRSSLEANIFFDSVAGRGVGLASLLFDTLDDNGFQDFVVDQNGKTQGIRVVYSRRLNKIFNFSAGYSFGKGQKLSIQKLSNPEDVFENHFFQILYGKLTANLSTGTSVRTIFRLSPQATVFAVDPFQGQVAIHDPGLSIMVTQSLPNWGLPIDAKAILDSRNVFDIRNSTDSKIGSFQIMSRKRLLRGGILVRF